MYNTRPQMRYRFSKEEDEKLILLTSSYANVDRICWKKIASQMKDRTSRQCRERFYNYLYQKTKKGDWTKEEDEMIIYLYNEIGPKWAEMTFYFSERSNIDIKNRFSSLLRKKKKINYHQFYENDNKNSEIFHQNTEKNIYLDVQKNENPIIITPIVYRYLI